MGIVNTLKWLWDTRTEDERAYSKWSKQAPLQRRTQQIFVYIKDREEPLSCNVVDTDVRTSDWTYRRASNENIFNDYLNDWLGERVSKGIRIDNVWYSPETIVRIEMGESRLEAIE